MATKEDILSSFQLMLPGHVVDRIKSLAVDNDACFWAADHKSYTSTELRLQKFVDGAVEISIRVMKLGGTTNMNKRSHALGQSNFVRSSVYGKDKMNREVQPQGRFVYQKTLNCIGTVKKKIRGRPPNNNKITCAQVIDEEASQIVQMGSEAQVPVQQGGGEIQIMQYQQQQQQIQQQQKLQQQIQEHQQQQQQNQLLQQQQQQQQTIQHIQIQQHQQLTPEQFQQQIQQQQIQIQQQQQQQQQQQHQYHQVQPHQQIIQKQLQQQTTNCVINTIPANTTVRHPVIVNKPYRVVTKVTPTSLSCQPQQPQQQQAGGHPQIVTLSNTKNSTNRSAASAQIVTLGQIQSVVHHQQHIVQPGGSGTTPAGVLQPQHHQYAIAAHSNRIAVATVAEQQYIQQQYAQIQEEEEEEEGAGQECQTALDDSSSSEIINPGDFLMKVIKEGITKTTSPSPKRSSRGRRGKRTASLRVLALRRHSVPLVGRIHSGSRLPACLKHRALTPAPRCSKCSVRLRPSSRPTGKIRIHPARHVCPEARYTLHKCRECTHRCRTRAEVQRHVSIAHRWRHLVSDAPFRCDLCVEVFYLQKNHLEHRIAAHPTQFDPDAKVACLTCSQEFTGGQLFLEHTCSAAAAAKTTPPSVTDVPPIQ